MTDSDYLKCACASCQGHLEFPAHAVGITTTCPHCGVETKLLGITAAPAIPPSPLPPPTVANAAGQEPNLTKLTPRATLSSGARLKRVINVVWSILLGLSVLVFIGLKIWKFFRSTSSIVEAVKHEPKPEPPKFSSTPSQTVPVAVSTSVLLAKGTPPAREARADLQLLNYELHKAKEGDLQYIVGNVTNHAAKQYFNVKITFELTRQGGQTGDIASDTLRNLPANAVSTFKVNIIGTTPVTAAMLAKLEGEKE